MLEYQQGLYEKIKPIMQPFMRYQELSSKISFLDNGIPIKIEVLKTQKNTRFRIPTSILQNIVLFINNDEMYSEIEHYKSPITLIKCINRLYDKICNYLYNGVPLYN